MSTNKPQPPQQVNIQIQAPDEIKEGVYANLAMVAHSPEEFVLDFIFIVPSPPFGKLRSRVVMSAPHAKRFLRALAENVSRFEAQFGPIPDTQPPPSGGVMN
jgi:hypothetical protein